MQSRAKLLGGSLRLAWHSGFMSAEENIGEGTGSLEGTYRKLYLFLFFRIMEMT